jgi:hypothetical protein
LLFANKFFVLFLKNIIFQANALELLIQIFEAFFLLWDLLY